MMLTGKFSAYSTALFLHLFIDRALEGSLIAHSHSDYVSFDQQGPQWRTVQSSLIEPLSRELSSHVDPLTAILWAQAVEQKLAVVNGWKKKEWDSNIYSSRMPPGLYSSFDGFIAATGY